MSDRPVNRTPGPLARDSEVRDAEVRDTELRTEHDVGIASPPSAAKPAEPERDPYGYYEEGDVKRLRGGNQAISLLEVPPDQLKPGWDAQYVTVTIYNQPVEGAAIRQTIDGGWRPARARDFPKQCLPGCDPDGPVVNYGQQLFIRPRHMTEEAIREGYQQALAAQRQRTQQSAQGNFAKAGDRSEDEMIGNMDSKIVRPVTLGVDVSGEYGTWGGRGR